MSAPWVQAVAPACGRGADARGACGCRVGLDKGGRETPPWSGQPGCNEHPGWPDHNRLEDTVRPWLLAAISRSARFVHPLPVPTGTLPGRGGRRAGVFSVRYDRPTTTPGSGSPGAARGRFCGRGVRSGSWAHAGISAVVGYRELPPRPKRLPRHRTRRCRGLFGGHASGQNSGSIIWEKLHGQVSANADSSRPVSRAAPSTASP